MSLVEVSTISTIARRRLVLAALLGLLLLGLGALRSVLAGGQDRSARVTAGLDSPRPRVALQVGHWQHEKLPEELRGVGTSAGGTNFGGAVEWRVNLAIARETQRLLQSNGLAVELVPATVTPAYRAAAFVSIHTDGNADPAAAGFKVAPSANDESGLAAALPESLTRRYAESTGLPRHGSVTADMTNYYAFDSRRFAHAISPATPAAILETGFLTSPHDRRVIVEQPLVAAEGIANGILDFMRQRGAIG